VKGTCANDAAKARKPRKHRGRLHGSYLFTRRTAWHPWPDGVQPRNYETFVCNHFAFCRSEDMRTSEEDLNEVRPMFRQKTIVTTARAATAQRPRSISVERRRTTNSSVR